MREVFIKEKMPRREIKNLLDDSTLYELSQMGLFFKRDAVSFVGKALIKKQNNDGVIIYSLPKYIDDSYFTSETDSEKQKKQEYLKRHIDTIIEILLQLEKTKEDIFSENIFAASNKEKKEDEVEKISLAEYIINDYVNHGLYYEDKRVLGRQSKGKIAWGATIKKCQPFIDGDTAIYMKLIRKYRMQDYSQLITRIHASVVQYALKLLEEVKNYSGVTLPQEDCIDEDDLKRLVSVVRNYMLTAVSNRDIFLFRALEAWCKKSFHYTNLVLGTTSYHLVWEAVNDGVFGNDANTKSRNPVYHFCTADKKITPYTGSGQAIIDTMFIEKNGDEVSRISIFDSKYYAPVSVSVRHKTIEGYPANSDVAKQSSYLDKVKQEYGGNVKYSNSFLLPAFSAAMADKMSLDAACQDDLICISGYVSRGSFRENSKFRDNSPVLLIHVAPDKLYEQFLTKEKVTKDQLDQIYDHYLYFSSLT